MKGTPYYAVSAFAHFSNEFEVFNVSEGFIMLGIWGSEGLLLMKQILFGFHVRLFFIMIYDSTELRFFSWLGNLLLVEFVLQRRV